MHGKASSTHPFNRKRIINFSIFSFLFRFRRVLGFFGVDYPREGENDDDFFFLLFFFPLFFRVMLIALIVVVRLSVECVYFFFWLREDDGEGF